MVPTLSNTKIQRKKMNFYIFICKNKVRPCEMLWKIVSFIKTHCSVSNKKSWARFFLFVLFGCQILRIRKFYIACNRVLYLKTLNWKKIERTEKINNAESATGIRRELTSNNKSIVGWTLNIYTSIHTNITYAPGFRVLAPHHWH